MSILSDEEQAVVDIVSDFVDREVRPVVRELEHANEYPEKLIEQMKAARHLRPRHPRAVRRGAGVDRLLRRGSPRSWRGAG